LDGKKTELKDDGYFKSINNTSLWYKKDSLILATQAKKVFYIPDTMNGKNWQIVQTFDIGICTLFTKELHPIT
jgi:hypothetical protein